MGEFFGRINEFGLDLKLSLIFIYRKSIIS